LSCPTYEEVEAIFHELGDVSPTNEPDSNPEEEVKDEPKSGSLKRRRKTVHKEEPEPEAEADGNENVCIACGGEGINSRGGVCKPCGGSGMKKVAVEEEPTPAPPRRRAGKKGATAPEPEKPKTKRSTQRKQIEECPFAYRFGVDTDTKEECDECEKWDDCIEAKENA